MAKPELGTKRVCPETGRKFYDLNKEPVISPYTGKIVPVEAPPVSRARPEPAPGQVLIRVTHSGVCGTDYKIYNGSIKVPYPLIPGHEMVGERVDTGERVIIDPETYDGTCFYCQKGLTNLCPNGTLIGRLDLSRLTMRGLGRVSTVEYAIRIAASVAAHVARGPTRAGAARTPHPTRQGCQ